MSVQARQPHADLRAQAESRGDAIRQLAALELADVQARVDIHAQPGACEKLVCPARADERILGGARMPGWAAMSPS